MNKSMKRFPMKNEMKSHSKTHQVKKEIKNVLKLIKKETKVEDRHINIFDWRLQVRKACCIHSAAHQPK